jgi:hypothetical protein
MDGVFRIGITNKADYASTLENPGWPAPFKLTWKNWYAGTRDRMDARLYYFTPADGRYSAPVIEIGYLNSLKKTGIQKARHRRNRRKRNGTS